MKLESAQDLRDQCIAYVETTKDHLAYAAQAARHGEPVLRTRSMDSLRLRINHTAGTAKPSVLSATRRFYLAEPAVGITSGRTEGDYRLAIRTVNSDQERSPLIQGMVAAAQGEAEVKTTGAIFALDGFRGRSRPVRLGCSIGHPKTTAGSICCFVRDATEPSEIYVVASNHVIANSDRSQLGDEVRQPGRLDGGRRGDSIGVLSKVITLSRESANEVDAALCRLSSEVLFEDAEYGDGGVQFGRSCGGAELGTAVQKVGRSSGRTSGHITGFNFHVGGVLYPDGSHVTLDHQLEVTGDGRSFSEPGDSGAAVITSSGGIGVGMINAGSELGTSYASPLGVVLDTLAVQLTGRK